MHRPYLNKPQLFAALLLSVATAALTVAFGLIDASLLRPAPFPDSGRIVALYQSRPNTDGSIDRTGWSWNRIQLLRRSARSFESIASYSATRALLTGSDGAERVPGEYVSADYFRTLKVDPMLGRSPSYREAEGAKPEVVLGFDLWRNRLGGDTTVIGQPLRIGELSFTVVGIMPRGFRGLTDEAQLWIPPSFAPQLSYTGYLTSDQSFISLVARLAPEIDAGRASAEMETVARQIQAQATPVTTNGGLAGGMAIPLDQARIDSGTERALLFLLAAVGVLYLIACANAMSLFLERAIAERRTAAIRAALGASPGQLFQRYLRRWGGAAFAGGMLGTALALWSSHYLIAPTEIWRERQVTNGVAAFATPEFGGRVLLFGIAVSVMTALLVAWGPALVVSRGAILGWLRSGSGGSAPGSGTLRRPTLRGALVAFEVALAVVLVVFAGLLLDSYRHMRSTDLGVTPEQVATFMVMPPLVRYPDSTGPRFIASLLTEIDAIPGVVSTTVDGGAPANGSARGTMHIVGQEDPPADELPVVTRHYVSADHFTTLGITLRRGRGFSERDRAGSPGVAVISQSAAQRFWPSRDPIGQRIWFGQGSGFGSADSSAEIVGVVADVIDQPLSREQNRDAVYTPYLQHTPAWRYVFVRTTGAPLAIMPEVRGIVRRLEPEATISEVNTLPALIAGSWARNRFDALLFGGFGVLGLVLASAGVFALVLHGVTQRMREMGIRLALGSSPSGIVKLVLREGLVFPIVGLIGGVGGSLILTHLLRASLYGVTPTEPRIFVVTALLLLATSALACLIPARRAAKADPLVAMRVDG